MKAALLLPLVLAPMLAACSGGVERDPRLSAAPLAERLAAADPGRRGRVRALRRLPQHRRRQRRSRRAEPNLHGVVGRAIAQGSPLFSYSVALRAVGGNWSFARLDAWLADPAHFAPGANMAFPGLPDGMQRADVIRYLNDNGSNLPLPPVSPRSRSAR